jgi:NADH:ubiquinone oxidoreductase subunit C
MADYTGFIKEMGDHILSCREHGNRLYFQVDKGSILAVADYLFRGLGCRLSTGTAQESYKGIEVMYHFSHDPTGMYYCPVIILSKENRTTTSITPLFIGAEWIEREMSEMFGISFEGLPNPEPLLTGNHPENLKTPWIHRRKHE